MTNMQHACVLVFVPVVDILNINLSDYQFVFTSLCLMNFISTTFDAVCHILRVHYKSTKCDVSFPQGSVSMLGDVDVFFTFL